jgi:hypothetical protein
MISAQFPPDPFVRQVSGTDAQGRYILALLAKRTYRVDGRGRCIPGEQRPLVVEVAPHPQCPGLLAADTDLFPFKPATDVVVQGHAYAYQPSYSFLAGLTLGRFQFQVLVTGDRHCDFDPSGRARFSQPTPVLKVPLSYDRAYGGVDHAALARHGDPLAALIPFLAKEADPSVLPGYAYPRNPEGRGFLVEVDRDRPEPLNLPNLEDPRDFLTPDRMVVGSMGAWPRQPMPWSTDWVPHGWFPRLAYFGFVPAHDPLTSTPPELARGLGPPDLFTNAPIEQKFNLRFANGAAPALQLPYLRGDEDMVLEHFHPTQKSWRIRLPDERPKLWIDGRNGRLTETKPVISSIVISPDREEVSVVWCGSAVALRPYMPDELDKMPYGIRW